MSGVVCDETGEGVRKPIATILCIDDEESVRRLFQVALEGAGYRVLTAENGKQGLRLLGHQEVDLIFVDIFMPEMDGLELIPLLRKMRPANKIIAISGGSGQMAWRGCAPSPSARPGRSGRAASRPRLPPEIGRAHV